VDAEIVERQLTNKNGDEYLDKKNMRHEIIFLRIEKMGTNIIPLRHIYSVQDLRTAIDYRATGARHNTHQRQPGRRFYLSGFRLCLER